MNCICGCGVELGRAQIELNLLAGEVAIELAVWDKVRAFGSPVASEEVEALLTTGAPRYQGLLVALHAGEEPRESELTATREWLDGSRAARMRLHKDLPVPKRRVNFSSAEQARIDRRHPERSFSAGRAAPPPRPAEAPGPGAALAGPDLEALLLVALADVRAGRPEEAERALRRFLSEGT